MLKRSPVLQHRHIVQIRYENIKKATCCDSGSYDLVSYCTICGRELSCRTVNTPLKAHVYGKPTVDDDADFIYGSILRSILLLNARSAAVTCFPGIIQNQRNCVMKDSEKYLSLTLAELSPKNGLRACEMMKIHTINALRLRKY